MPIRAHQFSLYNTAQLLIMMDPPHSKDACFRAHYTIDHAKINAALWPCETCSIYPGPWNSSRIAVNGSCIILIVEAVGEGWLINHAVIHYREPTPCWHWETTVLHFAITGMKGNLMETLGVKSINQVWWMFKEESAGTFQHLRSPVFQREQTGVRQQLISIDASCKHYLLLPPPKK